MWELGIHACLCHTLRVGTMWWGGILGGGNWEFLQVLPTIRSDVFLTSSLNAGMLNNTSNFLLFILFTAAVQVTLRIKRISFKIKLGVCPTVLSWGSSIQLISWVCILGSLERRFSLLSWKQRGVWIDTWVCELLPRLPESSFRCHSHRQLWGLSNFPSI